MNTKRLAIRGVVVSWLRMGCAFAIAFVVTPILVRELGNGSYGTWSIIMSLTAYYAIADLGLRGAGVKFIAQFDAVGDDESRNKAVVTAVVMCFFLALAVALIAVSMMVFFPTLFDTGQSDDSSVRWVVLLTGLSVSVVLLGQTFDASLIALKRLDLANLVTIGAQLLQAGIIVLAVKQGGGLLSMAWIVLIVSTLSQLCRMILAIRMLGSFSLARRYFDWNMLRTLLSFGSLNLVQGTARRVMESGGVIIIGILLGPATVTFYAIAESLVTKLAQLRVGITAPLLPIASQLDAQERAWDLADALFLSTRVLFALAAMSATILIVLGRPLIDFWIGPGYSSHTYPVLCLLAIAMLPHVAGFGARNILTGMNFMRLLAITSLVELAATIGLGIVLITAMGLSGMAVAILLTQVVIAGIVIPIHVCRALKLSSFRFYVSGIGPGALAVLPALLVAVVLKGLLPPVHIMHVIAQAGCVAVVAATSTFFVCFQRGLRQDILRSCWGTLKNNTKESSGLRTAL